MNPLRLMFGLGPAPMKARPDIITSTSEDGQRRVVMRDDPEAFAARFNAEQIYGAANVPPSFGMAPVIEVRGADGQWTPVSGTRAFIPDTDTQIAMLQSFRETGKLGILAPGTDAIAGESGPLVSPATAAQHVDVITARPAPAQTAPNLAGSTAQRLEPVAATQASPNLAPALGGQIEATPFGGTRLKRLDIGEISAPLTSVEGEKAQKAPNGPVLLPMEAGSDTLRRASPLAVGDGMSRAMDVLKQQKSWLTGEGGVF